ncbi:M28 family peptidase [Xanthocytophaga agilis]|uniref:Type IV secretion system putative lipoprotein virB7 n=1 Tax=Xanthocytophaga agilis TaxID=3048010 RepID=A0AAE3R6J0_9BACT|nr:M28 family peptidase [Xanthocytophaga agilis]MDJ1502360.1 M28 family peptidase [Xanthocytophaga agilis]
MKKIIFFIGAVVWLSACQDGAKGSETQTTQTTESQSVITTKAPDFSADSAYSFVDRQVKFGPRVPNTAGHRACGDYLIATLKQYGAEVTVQEFTANAYDRTPLKARNIIASFNAKAPKHILLAAHWDTRHVADKDSAKTKQPIDGANDGASGTGILLEIARVLSTASTKPTVGVDIILFDVEDYGIPDFENRDKYTNPESNVEYYCLGSQHWGKNLHKPGYSAYFGILLDMAGAKNAVFNKEGSSVRYAAGIVDQVWNIGQALGYGQYFRNGQAPEIIDDHVYINEYARIPTIDIIDFSTEGEFGKYHHTHADNMQIIDKNTLKAVGQTVLQVVYQE